MSMDQQKLVQEWRERLAQDSRWNGSETLLYSSSCEDALDLTFRLLLPILPSSDFSLIREVSFPDLQQIWRCDYLVETEAESVEQTVRINLERDMRLDGFQQFAVDVGTEAKEDSVYWVFRVDKATQEKLIRTRFIQVNSSFGSSFFGYRIWRIRYQWGNEAIALAAPGGAILL